jgi:glycosyltransferase involved in cell wall biosynthesis
VYDAHLVVSLITLGDPQRLSGGYLYHRRMAEQAPRHGARLVFLPFRERPFPLAALQAPAVFEQARRLGSDAIVLDSIAAALAAPRLAVGAPRAPLVGILHQPPGGIDHEPWRTRVQAALDRLAYRRAELLLVASEHLAEQVAAAGVPDERIRVVPPGRDVPAPSGDVALDLRAGRRAAFLCVGNWLERKGILELLDAFARLPLDAATLHLAGDEEGEPRYAARVRRRLSDPDLTGRVVLHGRLPREGVAALYAAADVFVLPAFREPYGTVWGEAMACGLPVVGWRTANLPHLADERREGLLVPPGDVEALSRALAELVDDEPFRLSLGEAARRRALGRPTWEQVAGMFFGAIRGIVAA